MGGQKMERFLNKIIIGIELEEKHCEIARRRVAEATPSLFAAS